MITVQASGYAGGFLYAMGPKFRMRILTEMQMPPDPVRKHRSGGSYLIYTCCYAG